MPGGRARIKHLAPVENTQPYFYGANVEVGYEPLRVSEDRYTAELRGILGRRSGPWLFAFNPILGWALSGPEQSATPELNLNLKVGRDINNEWSVGFEHYAGFGRINKMPNSSQQDQVFYLVTDYERKGYGLNFGIGKGLTNASDHWVVKAIIGVPLNW